MALHSMSCGLRTPIARSSVFPARQSLLAAVGRTASLSRFHSASASPKPPTEKRHNHWATTPKIPLRDSVPKPYPD